jgi:glucose/arabinose dehydrogenase/alkylhydroperoxidase family enzyme
MRHKIRVPPWLATALALCAGTASAQTRGGLPTQPAPDRPVVLRTSEVPRIRVVQIADGLSHPWGMAFRRNGDILVTERDKGTLRVIRDGELLERDIPGVPEVFSSRPRAGLMDIALHPDDDRIVYLTYTKSIEGDESGSLTVALARGRLVGDSLTEVRDIFVADGSDLGIAASRLLFSDDGTLFMSVGGSYVFAQTGHYAQDPGTHFGKLLRLNADGTVPDDNPFLGEPGYLPEIYSLGHRNQLGLSFHPETGDLWATENGPQGGDEANIIQPGRNYGWPLASYSREYPGRWVSDTPWLSEFEAAEVLWWPSVAPSGMTFYTGEHFPEWRGNLFVGALMVGRVAGTGHLERIVFNRRGQEIRREWLLTELKQRVRDVRQGPDGYLYLLTEEDDAALLRIEPAQAITDPPSITRPPDRLTSPRLPPLPETEWTEQQRAGYDLYASEGHSGSVLRTLIRVPALADGIFPLMQYISRESTLPARHRTLLILRTAWLTQNANLWATQANYAAASGLSASDVLRVAEGPSEGWSTFEASLLGLADELFRNSSISDGTWQALAQQYDLHNLMDAVVTVAQTTANAILFNSLGIQPDDGAAAPMPTDEVAYRIVVPYAEPSLTEPRVAPVEGRGLRVSRTFNRHPDMARRALNPGYVLSPERSRLTPHDRELLILRTGWNARSVYEWAKHVGSVGRARDHGLEPLWIAQGNDAPGWTDYERALIDAADEMYRDTMISDETWARLSQRLDTHQLMSVAASVARYRMISMTLNALGVQPLPDDERFPALAGYSLVR